MASQDLVNAAADTSVSTTASNIIESIAIRQSATVYAYDLALQHQFGTFAKTFTAKHPHQAPQVVEMQTRAGAGLSLAGRMSEGTSAEGSLSSFVLTALTNPVGLAHMISVLSTLAPATSNHRLVLQVPTISTLTESESLALSPSLSALASILPSIPSHFAVVASSTAQESVDLAAVSYAATESHVVHLFDAFGAAREIRKLTYPILPEKPAAPAVSIEQALKEAGHELFTYTGSPDATDVYIAVNGTLAQSIKPLIAHNASVGIVSVRLVRPWNAEAFAAVLPPSAKHLYVVDDVPTPYTEGPLYTDVLSSVQFPNDSGKLPPSVKSLRLTPETLHTYLNNPSALRKFLTTAVPKAASAAPPPRDVKKLVFLGAPGSSLETLPTEIAEPFLGTKSIDARLLSNADVFSKPGGVSLSRIILSPTTETATANIPIDTLLPINDSGVELGTSALAAFTGILDPFLLKTHDAFKYAAPGSPVLVFTSWKPEELLSNIPAAAKQLASARDLAIYTFDPAKAGQSPEVQRALAHIAFLRLYIGNATGEGVIVRVAKSLLGTSVANVPIDEIVSIGWSGLQAVVIPPPGDAGATNGDASGAGKKGGKKDAAPVQLAHFTFNSVSLDGLDEQVAGSERNAPIIGAWHEAAKHIIFPEVFSSSPISFETEQASSPLLALRPEVPTKTYLVTCSVNKRLTPTNYSRNVFHLEFDTTGTGLTYAIGEALGVHGWNDEHDILDFCDWYGVDPNQLISVPVPSTSPDAGPGKKATRTVFQALQQQIDIFGRPPKSFFAALATYAKDKKDRLALLFIAAPEGAATLKKLGENETVSYADVLKMYPSARPGVQELAMIVGEIKERHYSIASAQSVVGDRVDLLVVTVDWLTPSGTPKFGQCTRYLAGLKPGQKVTVSIKPSVMKLPPNDLQPIIMAGLGTGAAPFRAFIQHRALLKSQNKPVGPLIYYFGSRHRSQEYLYGEEIEAYLKDGVVTHAGLAFSRDSDSKVYIQHKMQQDGGILSSFLDGETEAEDVAKRGVFYLCGPTWPVPDVYEALVSALVQFKGRTKEDAGAYLENLKEEERYVLEVY